MTSTRAAKPEKRAPIPRPGRQAKIDHKVVEAMAIVGATNCEIADFLGLSESVIRRRCADLLTKARADLKTRLRRAQITAALGGNPAMLIWLGKQMLGQQERSVIDANLSTAPQRVIVVPETMTPEQWEQHAIVSQQALIERKRLLAAEYHVEV